MRQIKAIVAVDLNWGIGLGNELLAHLPRDLQRFKDMTLNSTVVMGRKTLESLPGGRPLPHRENIVISRNVTEEKVEEYLAQDIALFTLESFVKAYNELKSEGHDLSNVFIIGGGEIYKQFVDLGLVNTVYITKMYKEFEVDTYFPNLDEGVDWEVTNSGDMHEENGVQYKYITYKRRK